MRHDSLELLSRRLRAGTLPEGAELRALVINEDERGSFSEFFGASWRIGIRPVQWSVVSSRRGVLRGMHLHLRHDEYFLLIKGRCCVGLRDLRPGSSTRGRSCLLEFDEKEPAFITFPRGILHGWHFFTDSIHVQSISDEEYTQYHPGDNLGCHWSDPALEIPWPEEPVIVSERANGFPDLRTLEETVSRISGG
ncbi:MAG: dTDP-4-dehydrorhamnose 3,5-epimerase family protein [Arenicellales bacterium]